MNKLPRHVAIVMDGNGRWARRKYLPRIAGHEAGAESVKEIVKLSGEKGIEVLTLFAFSSENWSRPKDEVDHLMKLFFQTLQKETETLHKNNVQLRIIGDYTRFDTSLREQIIQSQALTAQNTGLKLVIAANYSGRWDITHAAYQIAKKVEQGLLKSDAITIDLFHTHLCLHDLPEPDLFIRTSGEQRISNFMLWQFAYTELYFSNVHWPDFNAKKFEEALAFFETRQRRFGLTGEQIEQCHSDK